MVLALICSVVLAADGAATTPAPAPSAQQAPEVTTPLVPWFVPRSATLGIFINAPVVTPHFRIAWEGAIISQPRNDLIWLFTLGSGIGAGVQAPMIMHSQHVVAGGFGYRSDRPLIHWGFHVVSGICWYLADYTPGSFYKNESRVLGYIEGRLQFGFRITPHFRLAAYFGYASPFVFDVRFPGNTFVGGIDTGLVIDWR